MLPGKNMSRATYLAVLLKLQAGQHIQMVKGIVSNGKSYHLEVWRSPTIKILLKRFLIFLELITASENHDHVIDHFVSKYCLQTLNSRDFLSSKPVAY